MTILTFLMLSSHLQNHPLYVCLHESQWDVQVNGGWYSGVVISTLVVIALKRWLWQYAQSKIRSTQDPSSQSCFVLCFLILSAHMGNTICRLYSKGMHSVARVIKPQDKTLVHNNWQMRPLVFSLITSRHVSASTCGHPQVISVT
jgi:hypothetical protein